MCDNFSRVFSLQATTMPTFAKQESSRGEGRRVASDVTQLTASDDPVERKIEQDHKKSILRVSATW